MQTEFLINGNTLTCSFFNHLYITNDVNGNILFHRCCLSDRVIQQISQQELNKLPSLLDYLNTLTNVWDSPDCNINPLCHRVGNTPKCFTLTPPERFTFFEVSLDHSCNAKCEFCFEKGPIAEILEKKLNLEFKTNYYNFLNRLLNEAYYPITIRLTDRGEPLLWKKEFISFFKKAMLNENIFQIALVTNGLGFLDKEILCLLKDASSCRKVNICCSINALSEETHYKKMRIKHFWEIIDAAKNIGITEFEYVVTSISDLTEFEKHFKSFRDTCNIPIKLSYDCIPESRAINKQTYELINKKFHPFEVNA